jgi:hypothetical protein
MIASVVNEVAAVMGAATQGIEGQRLRQLLQRARQHGLGAEDADTYAKRLAPAATQLSVWPHSRLGEAARAVSGHYLESVIKVTASDLAARMPRQLAVSACAA